MSTEQLHRQNAPIDEEFDGVFITTKQQGGTYIILYAAQLGRMGEFKDTFDNLLRSVISYVTILRVQLLSIFHNIIFNIIF